MKKTNFILFSFLLLFSLSSLSKAYAGPFKDFFLFKMFEKEEKKDPEENLKEKNTTYKGKAVYLELEGDNVEYDHDANVYTTFGNSVAHIVDQNAILNADKIIYYGKEQKINAVGNVKIDRDGIVTYGESLDFDVTSNKYLVTNPETVLTGAVVKSRNLENLDGENNLKYNNGVVNLENPVRIAQGFGTDKHPRTFYSNQLEKKYRGKATWEDIPPGREYRVKAEKIVYDNTKEINNLTIYKPRLKIKNFSIPLTPQYTTTISQDPDVQSRPLVTPVIGTQGALGGFALGPSFNLNLTNYHILSLSPFGQIGDGGFGIGGRIGFYGPSTTFEGAYGSIKSRYTALFRQRLTTRTEFRAGHNRYIDGGFLGSNLYKNYVGFEDTRQYNSKLLMAITESGARFRTEASWSEGDSDIIPSKLKGFLGDAADENNSDLKNKAFKLEEQISLTTKPLFKIGTEKFNTALRFRTRNALRAYSTGDFQGIFTGGPFLSNTIGPLSFELGYDQGFIQGSSPLFYDQYLEGNQSIHFDGDVRVCEYLSLGGFGAYNMKLDDLVKKQIRAKVGPKDFKVLFNYDILQKQTQFGVNFLFGQPIDFEKFIILNSVKKAAGF